MSALKQLILEELGKILNEADLGSNNRHRRTIKAIKYLTQMVQNKLNTDEYRASWAAQTFVRMFLNKILNEENYYVAAQSLFPGMSERDLEEFVQWMFASWQSYLEGEDLIDEAKLMWDFNKGEPTWGGYGKRNRDQMAKKRGNGMDFGKVLPRGVDLNQEQEQMIMDRVFMKVLPLRDWLNDEDVPRSEKVTKIASITQLVMQDLFTPEEYRYILQKVLDLYLKD